ncbi:MAG: hypothetical protein SPL08_01555 [Pseudomonadota bacterium]|nr:hypothetical protein [Pseudomonadota bacterium]
MHLKQEMREHQSGRSLLEMIAVMAIMGLITLTFIIGYKYAIERHRSHVVIQKVSEMATSAAAQMILKDDFSLDEFKSTGDVYPYIEGVWPVVLEKKYKGKQNHFSLSVSGLSRMTCNFIVQYKWRMPLETIINDGEECQEKEGGNTILFAFNSDLLQGDPNAEPIEPEVSCPNISYETCKSRGYICACSESDESLCTNLEMKKCGSSKPAYHYSH